MVIRGADYQFSMIHVIFDEHNEIYHMASISVYMLARANHSFSSFFLLHDAGDLEFWRGPT